LPLDDDEELLLLTLSDALGRPLLSLMPQGSPAFTLVGRPVVIATQMPDPKPGSTPIAVGDWRHKFTVSLYLHDTSVLTNRPFGMVRRLGDDALRRHRPRPP